MSVTVGTQAGGLPDARAGSREALGEVLYPLRPYLLQIARGELPPELTVKGGASDLVQETFLEAVRDFGHFTGSTDGELRAWLRCLLRRHVANLRRLYRTTRKRDVGREVRLSSDDSFGGPIDLPAQQTSPSGRAAANEQLQALDLALRRLPENYRTVIRLRYAEQLSFDEVAAAMGRSTNAVTLLWFRAVNRMRDEIGADL